MTTVASSPRLTRGTHLGDALGSIGTGPIGTVPGLLLLYYRATCRRRCTSPSPAPPRTGWTRCWPTSPTRRGPRPPSPAVESLLELAGVGGGALPERMAPVHAPVAALPRPVAERLLAGVLGRIYRPEAGLRS